MWDHCAEIALLGPHQISHDHLKMWGPALPIIGKLWPVASDHWAPIMLMRSLTWLGPHQILESPSDGAGSEYTSFQVGRQPAHCSLDAEAPLVDRP
jgi:hypothetical protein